MRFHLRSRRPSKAQLRCASSSLALAFVLSACGGAAQATRPTQPVLLPDTEGAITHVLLQLGGDGSRDFVRTQAALVAAMPSDVHFRVSYGDEQARRAFLRELRGRGVAVEPRVSMIRTGGAPYAWVRDLFVSGRGPDGSPVAFLHHPAHLGSIPGVPPHIDTVGKLGALGAGRLVQTQLRLEGGCVVSDAERIFMSSKYVDVSINRFGDYVDRAAFCEAAADRWGRPVTLIPATHADAAEHLDLVMMPIGGRRIIVSSVALARDLAAQMPRAEMAGFTRSAHDVARVALPGDTIRSLLAFDVFQTLLDESRDPPRLRAFERIARELTRAGYELLPVPFLSLDPVRTGGRVVVSYTNVLQDVRGGRRTVYLPTYRLATFDDHAAATWSRCGFDVVRIDAFEPGLNGGALRCLSQVIRGKPQSRPSH